MYDKQKVINIRFWDVYLFDVICTGNDSKKKGRFVLFSEIPQIDIL